MKHLKVQSDTPYTCKLVCHPKGNYKSICTLIAVTILSIELAIIIAVNVT